MAYTPYNRLKRIKDIQEITLLYKDKGVSQARIYREHIYPVYKISKRTFDTYLTVAVEAEFRKLRKKEEAQKAQYKLF